MKVSDILTTVAVVGGLASSYFAYDSWVKYAGKPFDAAARNPELFRYEKGSSASRAPLVPTRINREIRHKNEMNNLATEQAPIDGLLREKQAIVDKSKALSDEMAKFETEVQEVKDAVSAKNKIIADNQDKIRQLEEATAVTGNPENLKTSVEDNVRRLNEANAELAKQKDLLDAAIARKESLESALNKYRVTEAGQQTGEMDPSFTSNVRDVFGRWGFVVINSGASSGVNSRSKLDVIRGGNKIAQLQVTTVEPGISVCAVIPGSNPSGVEIQPGDRVVVSAASAPAPVKRAPMPTTPAPDAPATETPATDAPAAEAPATEPASF